VSESPIAQFLDAVNRLDVDAVMALIAPDCRFLTADGRRAEGAEAVRELMTGFFATVRSALHVITAQWHQDDVWIAEVEGTYELKDLMNTGALPRAFVLREGPDGIAALHVYGARERSLTDHHTGAEGMMIGGRWMPPL
jgi:uncharacterized protein (TIGR02246 family)